MQDDFDPVLGTIRARPSRGGPRYLSRVLATRELMGAARRARSKFTGSRLGRGAGIGRLLASRDRIVGLGSRRAIVKMRIARVRSYGMRAAWAHLRYILREGAEPDGSAGRLYSSQLDRADGKAFLQGCQDDRHQFRLIVSAEDGDAYDDLRPLVRRFMAQMEQDLGTKLDWVAADHVDTGRPHSHIILRGLDDRGQDLIIAREYIEAGMRERVADLVTLDLGPRQDHEIARQLRQEVEAEQATAIDRTLEREAGQGRIVAAGERDSLRRSLKTGRLRKLESLGLAENLGQGRWKVSTNLEATLGALEERRDIVRRIHHALSAADLDRQPADQIIHRHSLPSGGVVGQLIASGLADELSDRRFLIVDGIDGRVHHVELQNSDGLEDLPERALVRLTSANPGTQSFDYRVGGVGDDLAEAETVARGRASAAKVRVELLSSVPLGRLAHHDGATWLDRQLEEVGRLPLRDNGFGRDVRAALLTRQRWLIEQGLGEDRDGFRLRPGALALLRERELAAAAAQISRELSRPYARLEPGDQVGGVLARRIELASGRFALIDSGRDFALLPWRPTLQRRIGQEISGIVSSRGFNWAFERGRSIEI